MEQHQPKHILPSQNQQERKFQIVETLLQKPSKKPDFKAFTGASDILKKAQAFMPQFIQTTDRLLSDPELLKKSQMDIKVRTNKNNVIDTRENVINGVLNEDQKSSDSDYEYESQEDGNHVIKMDIGVGVYDVLNPQFNDEEQVIPKSTEQIVKVDGLRNHEMPSSEDEDDDSDQFYYEFNSSDSDQEVGSITTKSTSTQNKRPLIQEIIPKKEQKKKTIKNKKKRLRKD